MMVWLTGCLPNMTGAWWARIQAGSKSLKERLISLFLGLVQSTIVAMPIEALWVLLQGSENGELELLNNAVLHTNLKMRMGVRHAFFSCFHNFIIVGSATRRKKHAGTAESTLCSNKSVKSNRQLWNGPQVLSRSAMHKDTLLVLRNRWFDAVKMNWDGVAIAKASRTRRFELLKLFSAVTYERP